MREKWKKRLVTYAAWFSDESSTSVIFLIYLLVRVFPQPDYSSTYMELFALLFIFIVLELFHKWLEKRYSEIVAVTKARTIWRCCCFTLIPTCILIFWGKVLYANWSEIIEEFGGILFFLITGSLGVVFLLRSLSKLRKAIKVH